jgi:hypothetical protein
MTWYWLIPYWNKNSVDDNYCINICQQNADEIINSVRGHCILCVWNSVTSSRQPEARGRQCLMKSVLSWKAAGPLLCLFPEGAMMLEGHFHCHLLWMTLWSVGYATTMVIRDRKKIKHVPVSGQNVTKAYGGNGNSASRIPNLDTRRKLLTRL